MPGLEAELNRETETAVAAEEVAQQRYAQTLRPVPKATPSLSEQWDMKEKIEYELRARIRRERAAIAAEYDRLVMETNVAFDKRVDAELSKLELARRADLKALADMTAEKLHEHERLAQRMS